MATNQTFNDFFAGQRMTLLAAAAMVKSGVPQVLPPSFYAVGPTKPFNNQVQWPSVTFNRTGATVVLPGSPPRPVNIGQTDWRYATIFNMREEMSIDFSFMQALASDYAPTKEQAMRELNTRMMTFNGRCETTRTQMVHSIFANGKVWIGSDGQVLATSSGAVITMDGSIPTGNQITKNGSGSTYNIGDWSSSSTDIRLKLSTLRQYSVQQTNFIPTNIGYGQSVPGYLAANTSLAPYLARNQIFRDALVGNNEIPNGFLGYNWYPTALSYLVKADGTIVQTFADNSIVVTPDPSPLWYECVEGGTQIPNGIASGTTVTPDATFDQMMAQFKIAYGKYAYGVVTSHPTVGQSMVQGDCFGPVFKNANVVFNGTVS